MTCFNGGERSRNSSIELLRIISMFMILASHFLVHNVTDYTVLEPGFTRFLLQTFLETSGKVGVVVFFTISAWFFLDRSQTVHGCVRRVWMLEREVLFYSLLLAALYILFDKTDIGPLMVLHSLLPLTWGVWWYPTAYALFLLFLPFLDRALRLLGRRDHLALCALMLVLYGVVSLVPGAQMVSGVYSFVYLYVLISAYRWYFEARFALSPARLIIAGFALVSVYVIWSMFAFEFGGYQLGARYHNFVTDEVRLPCLLIGFGIFQIFRRFEFHSRIINWIAAGSFAVYLITDYGASQVFLWKGRLDLEVALSSPLCFFRAVILLICIYLVCTVIDAVRRMLFARFVDDRWSSLFDSAWGRVSNSAYKLLDF